MSEAAAPSGLRPRPEPDPLVLALVAAAMDQLQERAAVAPPRAEQHLAWRFSGRWWSRPLPARRDRPWLR